MENNQTKRLLEALLFMSGEEQKKDALARQLHIKSNELQNAVHELTKDLEARGVVVIETSDTVQLGIHASLATQIAKILGSELRGPLTKATSEVLAIVAYRGPVTRNEIDFLRGVNSSSAVRALLLRKLIEQTENPDDARSSFLQITTECLAYFGVTSTAQLPGWEEAQQLLQETKAKNNEN